MRLTGIFLQIFGGSMCAVAGVGGSISFERYIKNMMQGEASARSMDSLIATGVEYALAALLVTAIGAYLIFYGARVARRAAASGDS